MLLLCIGEPSAAGRGAAVERRNAFGVWPKLRIEMLEKLDPRYFLARCVRCGVRGAPVCATCGASPLLSTTTPSGQLVRALGPYAGQLGERLRRLKYRDETHLAFPLGRALRRLSESFHDALEDALLVPVPLHPTRLAERGYNQSALIAAALARRGSTKVETGCLFRSELRAAQARLSGLERRSNLLGAFVAKPLRHGAPSVVLVDDVVTTGSTIDACATALECIGVQVTSVLAAAIAGSGDPAFQRTEADAVTIDESPSW